MLVASVLAVKLHQATFVAQTWEPCFGRGIERPTSCPKGVNKPVCGRKLGKRSMYNSPCEDGFDENVNSYSTVACG